MLLSRRRGCWLLRNGDRAVAIKVPYLTGISLRMGRMLMPERVPSKRDATGPWRLSGYCRYGRYRFPVLPENFPFASFTGIWVQSSDLSDDFRDAQRFEARDSRISRLFSRFTGICLL